MAPRRQKNIAEFPTFDPMPSLKFGAGLLGELNAECALIGQVAMWFWLENPADQEYTKDVDFAVTSAATPAIIAWLQAKQVDLNMLQIGGVNARIEESGVRTDFVDRSSEEWGDLQPLYKEAIIAANQSEWRIAGVPVAPPEHLVAMKIGAATDKDERDAIRLLAKVQDIDVSKTRDLVRRFLGASGIGRLEECLRRAGHPEARRAYTAAS